LQRKAAAALALLLVMKGSAVGSAVGISPLVGGLAGLLFSVLLAVLLDSFSRAVLSLVKKKR
jgi:hypothetical protein